ncbi:hypothetical protein [Halosegnis rubeus]|uniref:DUF8048 domain-containing protein n=1 Tax=Halosegnis rubeus TaxID=2212850 RepID=A0A5N5UJ91_9EURY|nr:hypothetical protein [Halosegnis rubeus]KAB7518829.1 hypothetical protein DP108_06590 [Halosegnis rubeus]
MSDDGPNVYVEGISDMSSVGDPFVGVPISRDIIESTAAQYSIDSDSLASVLQEVRNTSIIETSTLFTGFDPLPVGQNDSGLLYVIAEAEECWDAVAGELELTETGRDAVAAAHHRQVEKVAQGQVQRSGVGFVIYCSEFPTGAVSDIIAVANKTKLTHRQTTIWVLSQYVPDTDAIAHILSLPEPVIQSQLAVVNQATEQSVVEARTLDVPGVLSRIHPSPQSPRWMGLEWSKWFDLRERDELREKLPQLAGLYRVRHSDIPGLMYIGESGAEGGVRERVGISLSAGVGESAPPTANKHGAADQLRQITEVVGGKMEVSVATPPISSNQEHRRAIESALVAVCRRETGRTPMVQLNREPIKQASEGGSKVSQQLIRIAERSSYRVPSWRPWRDVTSENWLGLNWTAGNPLSERDSISSGGTHAFRVWREEHDTHWSQTLHEVGTTGVISSRLFDLQNEYGTETIFSVVKIQELSADTHRRSRELREVRSDLVGAHYLATGSPPVARF